MYPVHLGAQISYGFCLKVLFNGFDTEDKEKERLIVGAGPVRKSIPIMSLTILGSSGGYWDFNLDISNANNDNESTILFPH